jgi:hypothetical protein
MAYCACAGASVADITAITIDASQRPIAALHVHRLLRCGAIVQKG